jgi:hypothetical protein
VKHPQIFSQYFEDSISFLSSHFYLIATNELYDQFLSLPFSVLKVILSSPVLKLPDETFLFDFIMNSIKVDQSNTSLIQYIKFPAVVHSKVEIFFKNFDLNNYPLDFIDTFLRIFEDGFILPFNNSSISKNRWENSPVFSNPDELTSILKMIDEVRHQKSRIEALSDLISTNKVHEQLINFVIEKGMTYLRRPRRSQISEDWIQAASLFKIVSDIGGIEGMARYGICILEKEV